MIVRYTCEICGLSSYGPKSVERCEAQGKNPKFSSGQRAVFGYGNPVRENIIVEIDRVISYSQQTHLPIYFVRFPPEYSELGKQIDSVPENWLKPVS